MAQHPDYDLIAVDLDGTLFNSSGEVSDANRLAIQRAREAGLRITICTGRGLAECRHAVDAIEQTDEVIVAGGSIIACPVTSRTQHRFTLSQDIVADVVDHLLEHGHPALVLKDPLEAEFDYLVVTGERDLRLDPVTEWWFSRMDVRVKRVRRLADDEHPEHTVRVGACGLATHLESVERAVSARCGDRVVMHNFPCVVAPEHRSRLADGQKLHILEVFDAMGNKWSAIRHLAAMHGVPTDRIVAIGDEVNDVVMIEGAGLGVAMGNAVEAVRSAADRHTLHHDEHGVAHAIDRVLAGEW